MKKITAPLLGLTTFFLSASPVLAQVEINISPPSTLRTTDFATLMRGAIGFILVVAALAAFIYLIWGGVSWITSGGDKTKTEAARSRIMAAIIGLFVVFAAWAIMSILGEFFGFNLGNLSFPTGYEGVAPT